MLTESDKVVVTKYPALPATCVVCLRSANGVLEFIDFQMSLDIYGSVNICVECLVPIGQLIGLVNKDYLEEAEETILDLQEKVQELEDKNAEYSSTLDSLVGLRPNLEQRDLSADAEPVENSGEDKLQLDFGIEV